jgi:hypothetical protein
MTLLDDKQNFANESISNACNSSEWVDPSMERHDLYDFEAKMDYHLQKNLEKNKYRISAYFFFPQSLQVTPETYTKENFYADTTTYLRFKTPKMALSGIINESNDLSPLFQIYHNINKIKDGAVSSEVIKKIIYELRLLGCILKASLRDQFTIFIKSLNPALNCNDIQKTIAKYLSELKILFAKIIQLGNDLLVSQIPPEIREAYNLTNDYISLHIEQRITKFVDKMNKKNLFGEFKKDIIVFLEKVQAYRLTIQSHLLLNQNDENESFVYWEGILKKYTQSILYLDMERNNEKSRSIQLFYSVAAGIAMFISLFLGLLIANEFEQNSIAFILALVVAYMFKDRIKDNIRFISDKALGMFFSDRRTEIRDPNNDKNIGYCKENMSFINWSDVSPEIINIREASNKSIMEREGKPELVIQYKKIYEIDTNQIADFHQRHGDINEIFRFNIKHFLQYADDPITHEKLWLPEEQKINKVVCNKTYHINIVFKIRFLDSEGLEVVTFKKVRVIFDQNGIKRVVEPKFSL